MLTLKKVEQEIQEVLSLKREELTDRQISTQQSKVRRLNFIKNYLLDNPSKDFIESEVNRIYKRLKKIDDNFMYWKPPINTDVVNPRKEYEKEMGVPKLKDQIEFLQTILSNTL